MNVERYDKLIWRVNGTLIFLTCVAVVLVCAFIGAQLLKEVFSERRVHDVVNVNQDTKKEEFLRLGWFENLEGTDLLLVPLSSEEKIDMSLYSKGSSNNSRNFLFLNAKTKDSYWIYKNNSALVISDTKVFDQIENEKSRKAIGLLIDLVDTDSNKDGVMNHSDQRVLQYFDLNQKKLVPIVSGVDRSIGQKQVDGQEVLSFYSKAGKSFYRSLNLKDLTVSAETEVAFQ